MPAKAAGQRIRLTLVPDSAPRVRAQRHRRRSWRCAATRCPSARCRWTARIPTGTTRYEKRNIADEVPIWESDLCIQCGQCAIVCPHSVIRAKYYDESRLARRAGSLQGRADQRARLSRLALHAAGLRRRLHRLRRVRGELSRAQPGRRRRQGDQHEGSAPAPRRRPREHPLLRDAALGRPHAGEFRQRARRAVPRAAVRVLGRLRRVRRDAVPQADVAALRRSAADRQRHRAARRSTAATCRPRRGPPTPTAAGRRGRTRSSRTTPSSASAIASPSTARPRRRGPWRRQLAPRIGEDLVTAILQAPQVTESDFRVQRQRVAALKAALAGATDPDAANLLALADFLVRRSVWIVGGDGWAYDIDYGGLDHVLAVGQGRQHPRARHRGLFEHRRPGVEGDAARRVGEVRRGGQDDAAQGPGDDGHHLRQRLRRPDRHGRQQRAGARGDARGRGLRGTVADPGLLAVHRPRHRHAPRHEAGGARRGLRLLAAVPLRSDDARTGDEPVPARLAAAAHSARGVPLQRSALQVADADAPGRRQADARRRRSAALEERYRVYEDLAARDGSRFHPHWQDVPS